MFISQILLTLFIFVPRIKGDPRIASLLPFDLTVACAAAIYLALALRLKHFDWSTLPRILWLYFPFIFLMLLSISYSPLPYAGMEKAFRFIFLTGLAIIAPYFVLNSPQRMYRHFVLLMTLYLLLTLEPLLHMGEPIADDSDGRLTPTGGTTIELGTSAVAGITTILYLMLPGLRNTAAPAVFFLKKTVLYLLVLVFITALIGAGARSAFLTLVIVVVLNFFFYQNQKKDLFLLTSLVATSLLFIDLPEHALEYLGTLIESDAGSLMNWRGHLMRRGLELIAENPFLGVGLGGFPYYGTVQPPKPWFFYNWPHNGMIEIGCEMGLLSASIALLLLILPFIETFRQLAAPDFPFKMYSKMNLALLSCGFLTFMNTGDINDLRTMWMYMSLPFVVRGFDRPRAAVI